MFFRSNFFLKINPTVLSQTKSLDQRPNIHLDNTNFELAFGVFHQDGQSVRIDETIFQIFAYSSKYVFENNETNNKIWISDVKTFHLCTLEDFHHNSALYYNNQVLINNTY